MPVERIRSNILPVREAIAELEARADEITGLVVLVSRDNDENYDYYVAGTIGAERALGRLEIIKRAILNMVRL